MLKSFYPGRRVDSVYELDYAAEYASGIRGLIFDIDNTLVPHNAAPDGKVKKFMDGLRKIGFKICLISNNGKERVKSFAGEVKTEFVFKAGKPKKRGYVRAMTIMGTRKEETLVIGDQILTDIYGANRMGIRNVMVKPVNPAIDPPQVKFKRHIDRMILKSYKA